MAKGLTRSRRLMLVLMVGLSLAGCTRKNQIWIYTSTYKEVIAEMEPLLKKAVPEIEIKWFQGGSENVAAKVSAELVAGGTRADLILTSDPFWYMELKENGRLLPYDSPAARGLPERFVDPDHAFAGVRLPVMVMAYNPQAISSEDAPRSWKDLASPRFKNRFSMGSPMESGTMFTAVALLVREFGWDLFAQARSQEMLAAGGNSSVINRMETRERPVGMVLLENVLKAQKKGSPVRVVYPLEGVIPVMSPIAIMKDTRNPEIARKIYDWFFSREAQSAFVRGGLYSPLTDRLGIESPRGAMPWKEISGKMMKMDHSSLVELFRHRDETKIRFSEEVLK